MIGMGEGEADPLGQNGKYEMRLWGEFLQTGPLALLSRRIYDETGQGMAMQGEFYLVIGIYKDGVLLRRYRAPDSLEWTVYLKNNASAFIESVIHFDASGTLPASNI